MCNRVTNYGDMGTFSKPPVILLPPGTGGSGCIISVEDYADNSFAALGSSE